MRFRKEEVGALAFLTMAILLAGGSVYRIVIEGQDWTSRRAPWWVAVIGAFCLGFSIYLLSKDSFGEPERNGRRERPLVFWSFVFAFACFGAGFLFVGVFATFR